MNSALRIPDEGLDGPASRPFLLYQDRIRPVIEAGRADPDSMYARVMGRPEIDPVLLLGITQLQALERVPDRQAVERCLFDVRWRLALGIPDDWKGLHARTLSYFRGRLIQHDRARWVLEAGYLGKRRAGRIDSPHVLADLSAMSRLECARETLRLTLLFLQEWGGPTAWEPWCERYCDRTPSELRTASVERLKSALAQTGEDMRDVLARAQGQVRLQPAPLGCPAALVDPQEPLKDNRKAKTDRERRRERRRNGPQTTRCPGETQTRDANVID